MTTSSTGSLSRLGECLDRSWQQKKLMAPGCEPASVRAMMEALRPLVLGQSLAGAGGGGFLYLLTREPRQREAVLQVLNNMPVRIGQGQRSNLFYSMNRTNINTRPESVLYVHVIPL